MQAAAVRSHAHDAAALHVHSPACLQDKEGKVAYLTKIIAVVSMVLNEPVPAKPLKVCSPCTNISVQTSLQQKLAAEQPQRQQRQPFCNRKQAFKAITLQSACAVEPTAFAYAASTGACLLRL